MSQGPGPAAGIQYSMAVVLDAGCVAVSSIRNAAAAGQPLGSHPLTKIAAAAVAAEKKRIGRIVRVLRLGS